MNLTVIFCCYVLLPYFATLVAPPQVAITCSAGALKWLKHMVKCVCSKTPDSSDEEHSPVPVISVSVPDEPVKLELEDQWFTQNLDHYHFSDTKTWQQRYLVNDRHYDNKGTVFILIGTDEEINSEYMQTGRWIQYAKEAKALCVGIELRYYGRSIPTEDLKTDNLVYLNNEQALADIAWFVYNFPILRGITVQLKWIAFGKSRGGTLGTWLNMKFPHLIHGTLSLSAPLLAKADFNEFFEGVETEMFDKDDRGKSFKETIREAFQEISSYVKEQQQYTLIGQKFGICEENALVEDNNIDYMYFTFAQVVAKVMQLGKDNLKEIKKEVYDIILSTDQAYTEETIDRFGLAVNKVLRNYEKGCLMIDYVKAVDNYQPKTDGGYQTLYFPLPQTFGSRSYLYQSCTEFGYFQTFGAEDNFFGTEITLKFYTDFCQAVFGNEFDQNFLEKGVHRTNLFYGGMDIVVSHVVLVYGDKDPLRKLGITDSNKKDIATFLLKDAFHCDELDDVDYVPQINDIKRNIIEKIKKWLK